MSDYRFNTYYILNEVTLAERLIEIITKQNIKEDDLGVITNDPNIVRADLPELDLSDQSKLPESLKRGAILGSTTGLLAGVALATFPVAGIALGGMAIASMAAGGAAAGAWSASMIGISEPSELVKKFDEALASGRTVILADLTPVQRQGISVAMQHSSVSDKVEVGEIN